MIEVVNSIVNPLSLTVKKIELNMNYLVLELHNKMKLLRGKIEHYKKWLDYDK